jgi:hypothetical protein
MERKAMHEFLRDTLSRQKLRQLFVNTALGNFAGYLAGSLVTGVATYHSVERRALKNLFGILPRHSMVVHVLPEWLEWALSVFVGFLVMEFVRYVINRRKYLLLIGDRNPDEPSDELQRPPG